MTQGHQLFAAELALLAAEMGDPRVVAVAADVSAPLRVTVGGRRGVGRRTVAEALDEAGMTVCCGPNPEVAVYVVAETVKPEDTAAVRAAARHRPVLAVLNKADLPGRCGVADAAGAARVPVESMSALFALAARADRLDDRSWAALRCLAGQRADLSSAEHFVSCPHPVSARARERLCAVLDLSGIERAIELARRGGTLGQARTMLRRISGVDRVITRLAALSAGVYHQRMTVAVARLEALAVGGDLAGHIDQFLTREDTVAARMSAAMSAAGVSCLPGEPALRRARRWQTYRGAPLGGPARACAADIARGSLRAWAAATDRTGSLE